MPRLSLWGIRFWPEVRSVRPCVAFPGTGTMRIAGLMSSRAQSVAPLGGETDEAIDAILRFMHLHCVDGRYADGHQSSGDALVCAITGGGYCRAKIPPPWPMKPTRKRAAVLCAGCFLRQRARPPKAWSGLPMFRKP